MALALRRGWFTAVLILLALLGGGRADDGDTQAHQAVALADQEDEVCGMLVREQSAPRGQVVHRDGSPHNIMGGLDGVSRLTDFGVANVDL